MIDIHCHLLPDVDDGPSSWEESIEMSKIAVNDGIKYSITTPHWIQGTKWQPDPGLITDKVSELNSRLADQGINLKVFSGMEIGISENLSELLDSDSLLTLANTKYVLLEIPILNLPFGIERIMFELNSKGFVPVLAHPERNRVLQKDPEKIQELIDFGALVQITSGSLFGLYGEGAKDCATEFARLGCVDIVASDAHSARGRRPEISNGLDYIKDISGEDLKERILAFMENFIN